MHEELEAALLTGDAEVDGHHREILARAAWVTASIDQPELLAQAALSVPALADYVRGHFEAEERLMVSAGYPGLEAHRAAHQALRAEYRSVEAAHRAGGATAGVVAALAGYLGQAILPHLAVHDRALAAYLTRTGPRPPAAPPPQGGARPPQGETWPPQGLTRPPQGELRPLEAAGAALDRLGDAACLLGRDGHILRCNLAWDAFAGHAGGAPEALGERLRGRAYLSCVQGAALVTRLGGVLRRAFAGEVQTVAATCHGPEVARLIDATYAPVLGPGGAVAGVSVVFHLRHVLPIGDLYAPCAPGPAFLGPEGQLTACAGCGRVRRRGAAGLAWAFVPAYLGAPARHAEYLLCDPCYQALLEPTRG